MAAWWDSLGLVSQIFAAIAIPATLILLIQTILMLIGIGSDHGGDCDIHGDMCDGDHDIGGLDDIGGLHDIGDVHDGDVSGIDGHDGVFGNDMPDGDHDPSGMAGLRIFTLRGIIAFFVVFGWVGVVCNGASLALPLTLTISFLSGLLMMFIIALLMKAVMKLQSDGTSDIRNALGVAGTVYLTVPAKRSGQGKVNVMLQGTYVERDAVTDENEPIPTGSEVLVIGISGQNTLIVKKK